MRVLTLLAFHVATIDRHLHRVPCPALARRRELLLERMAEERAIARHRPNTIEHFCGVPEDYPFCACAQRSAA